MNKLGIIEEFDKLGRIVIPKELRERYSLKKQIKIVVTKWLMFLAENLKITLGASIAFDWSNTLGVKPQPILQAEIKNNSVSVGF